MSHTHRHPLSFAQFLRGRLSLPCMTGWHHLSRWYHEARGCCQRFSEAEPVCQHCTRKSASLKRGNDESERQSRLMCHHQPDCPYACKPRAIHRTAANHKVPSDGSLKSDVGHTDARMRRTGVLSVAQLKARDDSSAATKRRFLKQP